MDMNVGAAADAYTNDYIEIQTLFEPTFESSITTACFDQYQELFWTGNAEGRVTSYYGTSLSKYTSFRVKQGENPDIRCVYPHANGEVYVLNDNTLSSYSRLGVNNFKHKDVSFQNMQCLFLNQQQRFFLGGFCGFIYDFDIERLRILRQLSISDEQSDCIMIKSSGGASNNQPGMSSIARNGYLCTGCSNGQILLREPFSLKVAHRFHPHSGSLSDFDVHGNYLVSCGFSLTRSGNLCVDRFLMVYDLRMMRSLTPVQVMIEPCFIHFLPMCSSIVAVASQSGCYQIMDTNLMTPAGFYQAQVPMGGMATTFSMSSNSQAFAFGHSTGSIHLFNKGENELFNDYSEQTFFSDPPQMSSNYIDINHEMAPLSSIPVPLNYSSLSSNWPNKDYMTKYRPTPPVSSELTDNARIINNIASVPNRINLKRNQIFNEDYEKCLDDIEHRSYETFIPLRELAPLFSKPIETLPGESQNERSSPVEENQQEVAVSEKTD